MELIEIIEYIVHRNHQTLIELIKLDYRTNRIYRNFSKLIENNRNFESFSDLNLFDECTINSINQNLLFD